MTRSYTVKVPATSANLGPGFDSLGLALSLYDEVTAHVTDVTSVSVEGEGAGTLPAGERHLVVRAMRETFALTGVRPAGISLTCVNRIPQARGLGSSSAAIVAGVTLANALAGSPLTRDDELGIANRLEGHPDNVAPCLLGGFTIAWLTAAGAARAVCLTPAATVTPTVIVPVQRGLTAQARAVLPAFVPHVDAAFNSSRSALLVHALTNAPELLFEATEDRLHQPHRAAGMPETAGLVRRLRECGVAAMVSGAGPAVLALTPLPSDFSFPQGWVSRTLAVQSTGAKVTSDNI